MSTSSQTVSKGRAQTARGREFEASVYKELLSLFSRVDAHVKVKGLSGINWTVDALVDESLIVEASGDWLSEEKGPVPIKGRS